MDNTVDIAVRWAEAGQDVPARTAAGLRGITHAAGEAAPAIGDRMATAFARLEAREPTMVLRRARLAVEEMAVSAVGVTGPLGRVAASFGLLAGPEGIGALLAVGAGGMIWHAIEAEADRVADNVERAAKRMHDAMAKAIGEGFGPERRDVFAERLAESTAKLAQLEASAVPAPVVKNVYTPYGYSSSVDTSAADSRLQQIDNLKTLIGQLTASLAQLDRESEQAAEAGLRKLREEFAGINVEVAKWLAQPLNTNTLAGLKVPTLAQLQGAETARQVNLAGDKLIADAISRSLIGVGMGRTSDFGQQAPHSDKDWERIGRALLSGMTMIVSARGGDVGAAALGALGETATAASGLKALEGKAKWLGPLGFGLSAAASLSSLFTGGQKPKVIIDAFEGQALAQIKELRSDPATTSIIIIGSSDMRSTQMQLARLQRMGVITRLPR